MLIKRRTTNIILLDYPHEEICLFLTVEVDTSDRIYDDCSRLLFLYAHREASALVNEIPEESGLFRFLRASCFGNIKGSVGLILPTSVMTILCTV